jgi:hypothetical protein
VELLIAVNPDPDSTLPYLMHLPVSGGMVFRTSGTWPRTNALYCYPVSLAEWPAEPEIVERVPLRSCARRGAVRWPNVPIVFCETRQLAEEWTYRFLAAANVWAETEAAALGRITAVGDTDLDVTPAEPAPTTAEVRAWASVQGIAVSARGKLGREVWDAWRTAHHDIAHTRYG